MKNVAIEKEDCAQCLILGGDGNFFLGGKVDEKLVNLRRAHFFGMALVVEEDVFLCPDDVGIASAGGIVFEVDDVTILVEEFFPLRGRCLFPRRGRCWRIWLCHFVAFLRSQAYNLCICT